MAVTTREAIETGLTNAFDRVLVAELLDAYEQAKSNFYLGGLRLSAVEGGRFCEVAYRVLQQRAFGRFEPIGRKLNIESVINALSNLTTGSHPDSVRVHIPRALRVVYDIRNNRDAAHLGDGIDPNLQDASLVVGILDWVLAEFVRIEHSVDPNTAQSMVEDLVTREAPVIQDFDGFLKVLRRGLGASPICLVLLYQRGRHGATLDELKAWVHPTMRKNLLRTLDGLVDDKLWVHDTGESYMITRTGIAEVDQRGWLRP